MASFLTDDEKKILLDRYWDIEWSDDVTHLQCVHCNRVAINHCVFSCQHLICNNCKEICINGDKQLNCPQCPGCNTQLDGLDFDVEVNIHQLKIFCPNKKYGCNYAAQLRKMPSHLMACVDTREKALPVESPATNTMEDVINHLKNLTDTVGELREKMTTVDNKVDEKFNQMEIKIDDIGRRISAFTGEDKKVEVSELKLDVPFASTDCTELQPIPLKLETDNQSLQEIINKSMEPIVLNIEKIRTTMNAMTVPKELQNERSKEVTPLKAETYEWTVKDVKKNKETLIFESEIFKVAGYKYAMKARINNSSIIIRFKDGGKINKFDKFDDGFTAVTFIVRDQSDSHKKNDIVCKDYLSFGCGGGYEDWAFESFIPYDVFSPPYVKDNCMKITILFEPPSIDLDFVSDDGVLVWRVDKYKERKQNPHYFKNYNWSPCFYTSPRGYRVRILLSIREQSMSVEVNFLAGKHDDMLSYEYDHRTTVTLINQTDPSKSVVKREEHRGNVDLYRFKFDTSKSKEQTGFFKDDSLLFKVVIEPAACE